MLIVNGVALNLEQPTTTVEKRVVAKMKDISDQYGLNEGRMISFVYPKEYLKINKDNNNKMDHPASFKIAFRDFVKGQTGSSEWRWCQGMQEIQGKVPSFFPKFHLFNGSWQLGAKDLDLIYYLIEVYQRTKNGTNGSLLKPYLVIEDKVGDAKKANEDMLKKAFITTALLNEEKEGGLSEDKIRQIASSLFMPGSTTKDVDVLRSDLMGVINKQIGGYDIVKAAFDEQSSGTGIFKSLAQKLLESKIVTIKKQGVATFIHVLAEDGAIGDKIMPLKGTKKPAEQLATYLSTDPDWTKILSEEMESRQK